MTSLKWTGNSHNWPGLDNRKREDSKHEIENLGEQIVWWEESKSSGKELILREDTE